MAREIEWNPWFAWRSVVTEDGEWAWWRWIERRKGFIGPRTAALGYYDSMIWHYRAGSD